MPFAVTIGAGLRRWSLLTQACRREGQKKQYDWERRENIMVLGRVNTVPFHTQQLPQPAYHEEKPRLTCAHATSTVQQWCNASTCCDKHQRPAVFGDRLARGMTRPRAGPNVQLWQEDDSNVLRSLVTFQDGSRVPRDSGRGDGVPLFPAGDVLASQGPEPPNRQLWGEDEDDHAMGIFFRICLQTV